MKIKTTELTRAALDWAVAKALGVLQAYLGMSEAEVFRAARSGGEHRYSENWAQGGPIIERELMYTKPASPYWEAAMYSDAGDCYSAIGHTLLIAAMRCYVASKLGDEVDVPAEVV